MQDRNNKDIICNSDEKQSHFSRLQHPVQQQQFQHPKLPLLNSISNPQILSQTSSNNKSGTLSKLGQSDNQFELGQQTISHLNIRRPIDSTDLPLGHFQQELSEPLTFVDAINNTASNMSGSQNSGFNYQDQEIQIKKRQKFGKATSDLGLQKAVSRSNYLEHDKNTQNCSATTNNHKNQSNNDLIGTSSNMFQSYYDGPTQNMDQMARSSDLFTPNKKNQQYEQQTLNDSFSKNFKGRDELYERALSSNAGVLQKTNSYENLLQMAANQNAFQQSSTISRMHAPSAGKTQRRRENKSFMKDRLVTSAMRQEQQQETVVRGQRQQDASQSNPESLSNVCGDFPNETAEFQGCEQAQIQQELYTCKNAGNWSEDGAQSDDQSSVMAKSSNQLVWKECEQFESVDDACDFTFDNVNQFEDQQQLTAMSKEIQSKHATSSLNELNCTHQINLSSNKNQIPLIKKIGDVDTSSQSQQQPAQTGKVSYQQREQQTKAQKALSVLADQKKSKPPLSGRGYQAHGVPQSRTRSNSAINPKTKVIHQKMVCYVSSFHLSINDWFSEYENIEILKDNLSNRLGSKWSTQFKQSIKSPFEDVSTGALFDMLMGNHASGNPQSSDNNDDTSQIGDDEDTSIDEQYFQLMFNLYLIKCYQATNIAEAYLTQKHFEASKVLSSQFNCDRTFDLFFHEAVNFVSGKGYLITDANLFRQVVQKFFYDAQSEYEKILIKIESDQKSKINFTEKALKQFDEIQRKQSLLEREMRLQMLDKQDHNQQLIDDDQSQMMDHSSGHDSSLQSNNVDMNEDQNEESSTNQQIEQSNQRKSYLGLDYARINEMGTNIPGFQMVKNNVIKPLIVATEKVVEYYFADSSSTNQQQLPPAASIEEQQVQQSGEQDAQQSIGQLIGENAAAVGVATEKQTPPSTNAQSMLTTAPSLQSSQNVDMCQFQYDTAQIAQQQSASQQAATTAQAPGGGKCPTSLIKTLQIQLDNLHLTTTDEDEVEGKLVRAQDTKKKHKSQVAKSHAGAPLDDGEMSFDNQEEDDEKRSNKSIQLGTLRGLGKKRTYRELERWDIQGSREQRQGGHMDDTQSMSGKSSKSMRKGSGVRTLKFNSRLLQKASTAVDLISQKIEFKNLMNQSVTGSFVTVILELTSDFIDKLEQQEQEIIQQQVQIATSSSGEAPSNLNIKFVKPSPHFYNKIMSLWFKFNHYQTLGNGASDQNNMLNMLEPQLKALFLDFCIMQFREVGSWNDQLHRPLENFIQIIVREHFLLQAQSRAKNLESQAANSEQTYDSPNSNSSEDDELNLKQLFSDFSKRAYNSVLAHGPSIFSSSKSSNTKKDDEKMDQSQSQSPGSQQQQDDSPESKRKSKLRKMKQNAMSQISMCTLFYNIKSALMKQWEVEIVQRGTQFESRKEQIGSFQ